MAAKFATQLLGWKPSSKNKLNRPLVPNCADADSAESIRIAEGMLDALKVASQAPSDVPKDPGIPLEFAIRDDLNEALASQASGRDWIVERGKLITGFDQYAHLNSVHELVKESPPLRVTIGMDYLIKPDVTVGLGNVVTSTELPLLHAAISCKWTIRSDRVQNIRHECLQMIRHRRGRQPHLIAVTAEPLPTRLAAIARGTGEVDAVYHIAFDELTQSVDDCANPEQVNAWKEVVGQRRLLSYEDLLYTISSW